MVIFFDTLLTTCQTELICSALAIARRIARQSPSEAATAFLKEYDHALEEELFQVVDIRCGELRAKRILAGASGKGA